VRLYPGVELSNEAAVAKLYADVSPLWASIHLAGGFAMKAIADTGKSDLMGQIETNLVSAFLCSRAAVVAINKTTAGGRIVNVAARPALEPRSGAGMTAYTASKAGVAAFTAALAEEVAKNDILVNAVAPLDHGHAREPQGDAESGFLGLAESGGSGGDDPLPCFAREQGHTRSDRTGLREKLSVSSSACSRCGKSTTRWQGKRRETEASSPG
jgi:NAD(P)-dependent dehydrogenase (short-subunit alcohol dehydrogenase family)